MSVKTILIAHRHAAVRDRFAAALADARHAYVIADTAPAAAATVADISAAISLVLLDLGLSDDAATFVRSLKQAAHRHLPIVIFAGSLASAAQVGALLAAGVAGYVNEHAATPQILPALAPHLFPHNFNRRTSPRVALGVPVSYRAGQTIAGAITRDVGKGGLAIRSINPLPVGTMMQLKFRLPGAVQEVEASGRVAWSDRKLGMGVQFERIAAQDQASIDALIDGH